LGWGHAGEENPIGRKAENRRSRECKDAKKSEEKTRHRAAPRAGFGGMGILESLTLEGGLSDCFSAMAVWKSGVEEKSAH
jgi:hypothetical protein